MTKEVQEWVGGYKQKAELRKKCNDFIDQFNDKVELWVLYSVVVTRIAEIERRKANGMVRSTTSR